MLAFRENVSITDSDEGSNFFANKAINNTRRNTIADAIEMFSK